MSAWDGKITQTAIDFISSWEKFEPKPYDDNGSQPGGNWSIGYGSLIDPNGARVTPLTPAVTEAQAKTLMLNYMKTSLNVIVQTIKVPLSEGEANALLSLIYNIGQGQFVGSSTVAKLNAGDRADAAARFGLWHKQTQAGVLTPMPGLRRRRWSEAAMFLGADGMAAKGESFRVVNSVKDWPDLAAFVRANPAASQRPTSAPQKPQEAPKLPGVSATPPKAGKAPERAPVTQGDKLALLSALGGGQ